ncbi:MarR family winged helix-turn-helix transcriptional regulator [Micromonospora lupini]|uniref:MarR family winged helix-turn-helix transcriptional regulator n=1 Tax=Micromonospora lupini TaxID=285679 RepID=UPI00225C2801|nr:MarR family winged helix-turn-helix transcriptional regulator [Micromonospora lupini]MCX5064291.1 MarR family winged helix-turn-helix transcriptional regulator [Micromonospora lupini]
MKAESDLAEVFERVVRLQVDLFTAVDTRLRRELGILLIALLPLRVIATRPDCRVQDIAEGVGISVGGASKSVDRLEHGGWVRRAENPADRRSSVLHLTAEGERMVSAGTAIIEAEMRSRLLPPLGPAGVARFATDINQLLGLPQATD